METEEAKQLHDLVIQAAAHVLPSCGLAIAEASEIPRDFSEPRQVVAFMGFTGDLLRGTMAVVAPLALMRDAYPLTLHDSARWEFEVFDWTGEVANRVLGRIKLELVARGVEIEASTPRVLLGEQLLVTRSTKGTVCSAHFPCGESWVRVWFDAIAAEDRPLFSAPAHAASPTPEGDVLLF
jgi:CheY-specific phosphatase CheX